MKIKAEVLQKIINDSIKDLTYSCGGAESFCIHDDDGVQVQITVTNDSAEYFDEVLTEYDEG